MNLRLQCYQSHQSGIETKIAWNFYNSTGLPIAPIWNWNQVVSQESTVLIYYQSHQSGIETIDQQPTFQTGNATNRTNLELKHVIEELTATAVAIYQSHQSGIETTYLK